VITHDVAISSNTGSDNACTHVIKLRQRPDGSYFKDIVFTKTVNGASLKEQHDYLRELIHIKFPNTIKVVIDAASAGAGLVSEMYNTWTYKDEVKNEVIEFPPLILDDDDNGFRFHGAIPMIRGINATLQFNSEFYPYMKACFENQSLRFLTPSNETDINLVRYLLRNKRFTLSMIYWFKS